MAVVVCKKGVQVKANGEYHSLGDVISGLSETEEKRLVKEGICASVPSFTVTPDTSLDDTPNEDDLPEETDQPTKKVKLSTSKKSKADAEPAQDNNESGPDTSHPLV